MAGNTTTTKYAFEPGAGGERALIVGVYRSRPVSASAASGTDPEESLDELAGLVETAGGAVAGRVAQVRSELDSSTLMGSGKLEELKQRVSAESIDLVVMDQEISGTQQRNLEKALDCRIVDRTQLILDIFARRARTREGHLQVELAQLSYLLPRLVGKGLAMSRLGGGIGTRGPGETRLETDRRRIRLRIKRLNEELATVRSSRGVQRRKRQSVPLQTVALAGYTNAGKSTLFNRLTGAGVVADSRLFATLDPTVRQLVLPKRRRVLLSDTVGFIRNLPTTLVEAFRATLEEVVEAAFLLHVVDASAESAAAHCAHVRQVLQEIGAENTPQLLVLNKTDQLDGAAGPSLTQRLVAAAGAREGVAISAMTGAGCGELLDRVEELLPGEKLQRAHFHFPAGETRSVHLLHEFGNVISESYDGDGCHVEAEVTDSVLGRLKKYALPG